MKTLFNFASQKISSVVHYGVLQYIHDALLSMNSWRTLCLGSALTLP